MVDEKAMYIQPSTRATSSTGESLVGRRSLGTRSSSASEFQSSSASEFSEFFTNFPVEEAATALTPSNGGIGQVDSLRSFGDRSTGPQATTNNHKQPQKASPQFGQEPDYLVQLERLQVKEVQDDVEIARVSETSSDHIRRNPPFLDLDPEPDYLQQLEQLELLSSTKSEPVRTKTRMDETPRQGDLKRPKSLEEQLEELADVGRTQQLYSAIEENSILTEVVKKREVVATSLFVEEKEEVAVRDLTKREGVLVEEVEATSKIEVAHQNVEQKESTSKDVEVPVTSVFSSSQQHLLSQSSGLGEHASDSMKEAHSAVSFLQSIAESSVDESVVSTDGKSTITMTDFLAQIDELSQANDSQLAAHNSDAVRRSLGKKKGVKAVDAQDSRTASSGNRGRAKSGGEVGDILASFG